MEHIFDGFGDDSFRLKLRDKSCHMLNIARIVDGICSTLLQRNTEIMMSLRHNACGIRQGALRGMRQAGEAAGIVEKRIDDRAERNIINIVHHKIQLHIGRILRAGRRRKPKPIMSCREHQRAGIRTLRTHGLGLGLCRSSNGGSNIADQGRKLWGLKRTGGENRLSTFGNSHIKAPFFSRESLMHATPDNPE